MTSIPQDTSISHLKDTIADDVQRDDNAIVISGISGLYPKSRYVKDFDQILYDKVNPITKEDVRWQYNHPEAAQYGGNVPDLDRFDAQFFKVHYHLGQTMDPMGRKILEQAYQAIYDAGVNPHDLSGMKVGVYIGSSFSETEKFNMYASTKMGFSIPGCGKTMLANRISYWLNAKGPSLSIDEGGCGSTAALEQAYFSLATGECRAAIVGGTYLCMHPQSTVHYSRIVTLSKDGKTKSFDQNADGNAKSEAVNVLFLQKAKDALRVYAYVKHVKCEYRKMLEGETGPRYGYYRDPEDTAQFLEAFYDEVQIPPSMVEYVEGFGSAVGEADKSELDAIDRVFCSSRSESLLVGSVMSNIGYGEAASGISAVTKVLLGYHRGMLAGNLHCDTPRSDVAGIREGRIKILTDHHQFRGTYAAINSMSVTGVNGHVLLCGNNKPKNIKRYKSNIPRLIAVSGRQESSVFRAINIIKSNDIDPEELALLNNIHKSKITGHLGRGYVILDINEDGKTISLSEKSCYNDNSQRPLWYVYSGMGSQWPGMGTALMRIPVFSKAIERCHRVLEPKGLNIIDIITSNDPTIFDNILNSFVGISAIQIGLTDVLRELGIFPDKVIGHSLGELGCAYADGCLTAEEMILCSYSRGIVSLESKFIRGSMAAVGLSYDQVAKICPPEIDVACHNSSQSSTVSGPEAVIHEFVKKLTIDGVFVKEVPCSNIAFHSRYMTDAGPALLKHLNDEIKNSKERSERWVSTSVPEDKWNETMAKYSSAEYHTNNVLNPVLFEEALKFIPSNAVLVEIAPHGLLQAILKRALPDICVNIPLTRRGHPDNARFFLESIGKLYTEGFHPDLESLYPKVEFPVSTGTPFLSTYVDWAHEEKWELPLYSYAKMKTTGASCKYIVSVHDDEYRYLKGHVIRRNLSLPPAFVLVAVWDTLAMVLGAPKKKFNVKFDDIRFYCQTLLHDQRQLRLNVTIHRGNGSFEVMDDWSKIATGYIKSVNEINYGYETPATTHNSFILSSQDVYDVLFHQRDYDYSEEFRSIWCVTNSLTEAKLFWHDNWVTIIDGMLQLNALKQAHTAVSRVDRIRSITIDVNNHTDYIETMNGKKILSSYISDIYDLTRCGGITIERVMFYNLPQFFGNKVQLKALENAKKLQSNIDGTTKNVMLQSEQDENIESLKWVATPEMITTGVKVKVHFAGINVKDVRKASGINPVGENSTAETTYGMEFSGITETGERVMGLVEDGSTRSSLVANPELTWPVPSYWSLEDAATVPLAYTYVLYCFYVKTINLMKRYYKFTVLIHDGAGALGQAAINVSLASGYRVFTTVSDVQKKSFLLKLFPDLKEEDIGCSRDSSFSDMVLAATRGKGADVVLSCVQGDLKNYSLKSCGQFGVTFDTDQLSSMEQYTFGFNYLSAERAYIAVDIRSLFSNPKAMKRIHQLMVEGICGGWVHPLTRMTFEGQEAPRAFQILAASKHRGRVLLKLTDSIKVPSTRVVCSSQYNYMIMGDNETLVLRLADRLINRGAKNIVLYLPRTSALLRHKINFWQNFNINVKEYTSDWNGEFVETIIKNALSANKLEGVYIVNTELDDSWIINFDVATRKMVPHIRHFLVLGVHNNDESIKQICLQRSKDGLSATYLSISDLKKNNNAFDDSDIMESIELSLSSQLPVVTAELCIPSNKTLHERIAGLVGIHFDEVLKTMTLQELGLEQEQSQIISAYLNDLYNIYIDKSDVPLLTLERIKEIENINKEKEYGEITGFNFFYTFVDTDELLATTELVFLPTRSNSSGMSDDEFDPNDTYLWIIPGMEGHHKRFRNLCEGLKLPAFVLQPGLDHLQEDVYQLAARYYKVLMKKTGFTKKNFYILGFESGVSVALELAALLEKKDLTGTVYCIGDGPKEIRDFIEDKLIKFSKEEELQTGLIVHMYNLLMGGECESSEVRRAMSSCSTWTQRVEASMRNLKNFVSHSAQYARSVIDAAHFRLFTARKQILASKVLQSQIVSIRMQSLNRSSLQDYTSHPIIVYDLPTPLPRILEDLQCTAIINRHLSKGILDQFNKRNLCDSYLLNSDHRIKY